MSRHFGVAAIIFAVFGVMQIVAASIVYAESDGGPEGRVLVALMLACLLTALVLGVVAVAMRVRQARPHGPVSQEGKDPDHPFS